MKSPSRPDLLGRSSITSIISPAPSSSRSDAVCGETVSRSFADDAPVRSLPVATFRSVAGHGGDVRPRPITLPGVVGPVQGLAQGRPAAPAVQFPTDLAEPPGEGRLPDLVRRHIRLRRME